MAQFTNQASISYNGLTANSNIVTGEITRVLSVSKTSVSGSYRRGDTLTYAVSISNTGSAPYTGLTVTDDLGAYTAGPPLTISGISVPAGGNALIVYRAAANDYAAPGTGGSIVNTASVSGGGLTEPISASETVTADTSALLSITKALNPTVVAENGQIAYTFTIRNTGAEAVDAAAALVVSDTFDPALKSPISVTLNGNAWPETGNYSYNAATGVFATTAGRITVPAAIYTQDAATGLWTITPGTAVLTVTGTI